MQKEQMKYPVEEEEHNYFNQYFMFLPQGYNDQNIIMNFESAIILLYSIVQETNNQMLHQDKMEYNIDRLIVNKYFQYLPQNRSVCLNIMRLFANTIEKQSNYVDQISKNPCIIYKNMPFSLTFVSIDCVECKKQRNDYYEALKEIKINNSNKEEQLQKQKSLVSKFIQNKGKISTHTRLIEIQISVNQNIFQNNYQHDQQIIQYISTYQTILQKCYYKYFNYLEKFFNPTKDLNQLNFEFKERHLTGTLLNKTPQILQQSYIKYTSYERLEAIVKFIKIFSYQIQKLLRYVYFFNLIGRDSNDLNEITEDLPVFELEVPDDQKQAGAFCIISRDSLQFDLQLKITPDPKHLLLFYISNHIKDSQAFMPDKVDKLQDYKETVKVLFRSLNYADFDQQQLPEQIKHMTHMYQVITTHYKNPNDKDHVTNYNIVCLIRILNECKINFNLSKKDIEIQATGEQKVSNPRYIMELVSFNDIPISSIFKYKIFFGRDNDNQLFSLFESDTKINLQCLQLKEIKQYILSIANNSIMFSQ